MYWRKNFKVLRKKSGKTQADIATHFNVSQQTVALWENGTSEPNLANLKKMADYFNVSFEDFTTKDCTSTTNDNVLKQAEPFQENWKEKYIQLLEKYIALLEKTKNEQAHKKEHI